MALVEGTKGFSARKQDAGVCAAYPYYRAAADLAKVFLGTPMVRGAGDLARRPTVVANLITDTKLLGFAATPLDYDTAYGVEFAQMPQLTDVPGAAGRDLVMVYPAITQTVFTVRLRSTITAAIALIGTKCNLWEEATDSFVVDTGSTTIPLVTVIGIHPDDIGLAGGRVDIIVPAASSSYITP